MLFYVGSLDDSRISDFLPKGYHIRDDQGKQVVYVQDYPIVNVEFAEGCLYFTPVFSVENGDTKLFFAHLKKHYEETFEWDIFVVRRDGITNYSDTKQPNFDKLLESIDGLQYFSRFVGEGVFYGYYRKADRMANTVLLLGSFYSNGLSVREMPDAHMVEFMVVEIAIAVIA